MGRRFVFRNLYIGNNLLLVSFHMFLQMITPHEPFLTIVTFVVFVTGVCSPVSGQFVTSTKPFCTPHPIARIRSFSSVRSDMSFQVGGLVVRFGTSYISTRVVSFSLCGCIRWFFGKFSSLSGLVN